MKIYNIYIINFTLLKGHITQFYEHSTFWDVLSADNNS